MKPTYAEFVVDILTNGANVPSRYGTTFELLGTRITSPPGEMLDRENTNYNVAYCETLSLIAGVYDMRALHELAPNAQHVLFTHAMAYGPRTTLQIPRLIDKLAKDPESRQCVLFVGKPEDGATNDQPCTTSLQFLWRHDLLYCFANMRSNDVIKGTPADLHMFHALTACIAHCLHIRPGPVVLTAGSSHIYLRDAGRKIRPTTRHFSLNSATPTNWQDLRHWAMAMLEVPGEWPQAIGRAHRIPPLFIEQFSEVFIE